jgi:fucose 4-O-acetylase-like acetyltransferase
MIKLMEKERLHWIDWAKFFGIAMIVFGFATSIAQY